MSEVTAPQVHSATEDEIVGTSATPARLESISEGNVEASADVGPGGDTVRSANAAPSASANDGRRTIVLNDQQERHKFHRELRDTVAETKRVFVKDGTVYTDLGGEFQPVLSANVMSVLVGNLVNIAKTSESGKTRFIDLPARDAWYLLNSAEHKSTLLPVAYSSDVPVLDSAWACVVPGYNASGQIFYEGAQIDPVDSQEHVRKLLEAFHFRRPTDRTNFLAFLLTPLLGARLAGERPMLLIKGNQPGIGKTTAAQALAILASAKGVMASVTYKTNDVELEKEIGACLLRGSNFVLIDNISVPANVSIRSASIERTITMPEYSFRRIGTSQQIRGPNYLLFAATYNGGKIGTDLASRCVSILMRYTGDPAAMRWSAIGPICDWVRANRRILLAELLGMYRKWRGSGGRLIPIACRFSQWAAVMNGVLQANDFTGFLETYAEDRGEADEIHIAFEELAVSEPGTYFPAREWRLKAQALQLFRGMLSSGSERSKDTKIGTLLSGAVGRSLRQLDDDGNVVAKFRLVSRQGRDSVEYAFDRVSPERENPVTTGS